MNDAQTECPQCQRWRERAMSAEGMAECMATLRHTCIERGIFDKVIPPMCYEDAVAALANERDAYSREAKALRAAVEEICGNVMDGDSTLANAVVRRFEEILSTNTQAGAKTEQGERHGS